MNTKQNLHVHSTFCDGKDTPEEMIETAIERGFGSIGFSVHSYVSASPFGMVTPKKINTFNEAIPRIKEKYRGIIDIYKGIEYDIYSDCGFDGYDYTIASVHYLKTNEGRKTFDVGADATAEYIDKYFDNDPMKFAKVYYDAVASMSEYGSFDVIGHFDLITKNNEIKSFFDTESKEYLSLAFDAIRTLKNKIPFFEVNTGAISRGYRTSPYPQIDILRELKANGFGAVISSDCHDRRYVDCFYEEAKALLAHVGFNSRFILTQNGFEEVAL